MSILTSTEIDDLLFVAFQNPQVANLITDLNSLPVTNPFSSTTSTAYSIASAPLLRPDELESTGGDDATELSGTYALSIVGFVGIPVGVADRLAGCPDKCAFGGFIVQANPM